MTPPSRRGWAPPTLSLALPMARLGEVPAALLAALLATAAGWTVATLSGAAPLAPSGAGLVIAIVASRLHRRGSPGRAILAMVTAGSALCAAGVALELEHPRGALALTTASLTLASAFPLREARDAALARLLIATIALLLLCAALGPPVASAPSLWVVLAASAPVALVAWGLARLEVRLARHRTPARRGPYR